MTVPPSAILCQEQQGLLWLRFASRNNTLTRALIADLQLLLDRHQEDSRSRVVILSGAESRFFSPGLDLREVVDFSPAEMDQFMQRFGKLYLQLFQYPKPTIAMLNGDALAGGCILASCCDFRIGFPELRIGMTEMTQAIPLPFGSLKIMEHLIGYRNSRELFYLCRNYSGREARELGWLDGICPGERLTEQTQEFAQALAAQSLPAFQVMKRYCKQSVAAEIDREEERLRRDFLACWFQEESQSRIRRILGGLQDGSA